MMAIEKEKPLEYINSDVSRYVVYGLVDVRTSMQQRAGNP